MNIKENMPGRGRGRGRGRPLRVVPVQRPTMGPPKRPAPKRKDSSTSPYTASSSSHINWTSHPRSFPNDATTSHIVSLSRSHLSSEQESRVVIALSEGRGDAMCEVGIAAVDLAQPSLIVCQISDSPSYINTLTKINILNPSEIIIPITFIAPSSANRLIEKIKEQFQDVKITGVTRSTFNNTTGSQYIKHLCVPSMNSVILILQHKYYALAAAGALLTYTENILYVAYARESIKIEYQESEGSTIIDVTTADKLELVASARPALAQRYSCLLDVLNHCCTKIGLRTLRASILQPPCSVPDIESRLDCVTELKEHCEMLAAIQPILQKLNNINQLLTLATVLPDQAQNCSDRQLNYILLLNSLLEQLEPLRDIFMNSKQAFFIELRETLNHPAFAEIKEIIRTLIHVDAHPARGQGGIIQRCFAIKSGVNSLLDLVRKTYSERLDDMREYVKTLGERYNLALSLSNTSKKGYHIVLTLNAHQKKNFKTTDLPTVFIRVERLASKCTMNTQNLIDLACRVEDINMDILKMSNIMIYKILQQIQTHVGVFYKLCEDIAKLDMLQSLAQASSSMGYVRPQFGNYLEVLQARHPLLEFLRPVEPIANSIYASDDYNINIVTGPNGSGKSIFIRQVVLLQVMAQVGCYVPAQSATLRAADRILARIYLEDNMACGASTFVLEMKEIQYFLTVLTKNTLIIADEPCRSTSVEEGTALAMAICEKLMSTPAFVFFTTHYKLMARLGDLHFKIKQWQLETLTPTIHDQMILRFTYNVIPGVTSLEHYGFFLAKGSWHEITCKYAEEILHHLSATRKKSAPHIGQANPAARLKYDLEAKLRELKRKEQLTRLVINEKLLEYQKQLGDLGYQVDLSLFSNASDATNNNRSITYENDVGCSEVGRNITENSSYLDYCNNFSQLLMNRIETASPINPLHTFTFNAQNEITREVSNAEMSPLLYGSSRFPSQAYNTSNDCRENLFNKNVITNNCNNFFEAQEEPTVFSGANNSMQQSFDFSNNGRDNLQDLSDTNIFEPQISLESIEHLKLNFDMQQKAREGFESSLSFMALNDESQVHEMSSLPRNYASYTNLAIHSSSTSAENLPARQKMSIVFLPRAFDKNESGYEGACSEVSSEHTQNVSIFTEPTSINKNCPANNNFVPNSESFMLTEYQFARPLQQNAERTSTPVHTKTGQSQTINWGNQMDANHHNRQLQRTVALNRSRNNQLSSNSVNTSASQRPNSNSSNLESIKWKTKANNLQAQSSAVSANIFNIAPENNTALNNISRRPSTESLIWNTRKNANEHVDLQNSNSDADVTTAINDLHSCSELFFDTEDWDSVDQEVKLQISKQSAKASSETNGNSKESTCTETSEKRIKTEQDHKIGVQAKLGKSRKQLHLRPETFYFEENSKHLHNKKSYDTSISSEVIRQGHYSKEKDGRYQLQKTLLQDNTRTDQSQFEGISSQLLNRETVSPKHYIKMDQLQYGMTKLHCATETRPLHSRAGSVKKPEQSEEEDCYIHNSAERIHPKMYELKHRSLQHSDEGSRSPFTTVHGAIPKLHCIKTLQNPWHNKKSTRTSTQTSANLKFCQGSSELPKTLEAKNPLIFKYQKNGKSLDVERDVSVSDGRIHELSNVFKNNERSSQHSQMNFNEQFGNKIQPNYKENKTSFQLHSSEEIQKSPNLSDLNLNKDVHHSHELLERTKTTFDQQTSNTILESLQSDKENNKRTNEAPRHDKEICLDGSTELQCQTPHNQQILQTTCGLKVHEQSHKYNDTIRQEDVQCETNSAGENYDPIIMDQNTDVKSVDPSLNTSLEPLGDIHLELFSDESITEEAQGRWKSQSFQEANSNQHSSKDGNLGSRKRTINKPSTTEGIENFVTEPRELTVQVKRQCLKQKETINTTDEYGTANSNLSSWPDKDNASQFEVPSSSKYFVLKKDDTKQLKLTDAGGEKLHQISKRRRLGDVSRTFENITQHQTTGHQPQFNKENSPDIFESCSEILPERQDAADELFGTPSNSVQKVSTAASTDSAKNADQQPLPKTHSNEPNTKKRKRPSKHKIPKFNPPRKLTKKEIERDYFEQNKKMLESENSAQYLAQIINRPSVKQLQQASHVASFHKTSAGVIVIPAQEPKLKTRRKKFVVPLKQKSQNFDITLFSDKNLDKFQSLMSSLDNTTREDVVQDTNSWQVVCSPIVYRNSNTLNKGSQDPLNIFGRKDKNPKNDQFLQSSSNIQTNASQTSDHSRKGYYTQNRTSIDSIVNKYLNQDISVPTATNSSSQQNTVAVKNSDSQ